ncbi:LEAF RUST 10 DISEASE-RESISTANCE LOCUS RECEPTOR-LIKE PROTEIN KINASE-like 2.5 isoform X2 [Pistacia vera]|nr:LEAF RUST 10 DISEASE-RESISTANCE LOCUS RECEPTOR-LIKE PROTEIN KINASE-like 2.5 isoform X2 [Pistacia vera]
MRREEPSALSNFLFSLLIFLFISEIQADKLQQACSSSCGDLTNISHPFRPKGDPPGCGDRDFELSCQSNKTILELYSGTYYVTGLYKEERRIRVVDINLANGSCNLPNKSLSISDSFTSGFTYEENFFSLYSKIDEFARFLNCSANISDSAYRRLPCFGDQSYNVYVNIGGYRKEISDLPESSYCSFISMVPILHADVIPPTYEVIWKLLKSGFDLRWSIECRDCIKAGGYCESDKCYVRPLNSWEEFLSYFPKFMVQSLAPFNLGRNFWKPVLTVPGEMFGIQIDIILTVFEFFFDIWLAVVLICRFIFAPIVILLYIINKYKATWKIVDRVEKFLHNQQSWMPKRYSYSEIIARTNHFKEELGQGGFGSVYKGQLHSGSLIAVKVLKNSKFNGEEFINEVSTIGRIHHVNIVQLVGFCSEGSKRALVYEYMANGSLDRHIFSKGGRALSFSWEKLHEIVVGTARGIEYLHGGCDVCILHFDIKPHNILLDHNLIPKISDFGLAKFYPKENDFVSISVARGTIGYIAPELISRSFGVVSCKSDVYSFGMLLLEMVGVRRNSDVKATHSSKAYFPSWVYDQINMNGDLELQNVTESETVIARKLCIIGLWCIQVKPTDRPSMTKVMEMLEGSSDDLKMPPKPFFSSSQHISIGEIESESSTELLLSESMEECLYNDSYV